MEAEVRDAEAVVTAMTACACRLHVTEVAGEGEGRPVSVVRLIGWRDTQGLSKAQL